jgi:hypothetical protein
VDEQHRLILRLFSRAAAKIGSAAHLAMNLGIPYGELLLYMQGTAIPPENVLLQAVSIIMDELPNIRSEASAETWESLRLPK